MRRSAASSGRWRGIAFCGAEVRVCVPGALPPRRQSSVRLHRGDSLAKVRPFRPPHLRRLMRTECPAAFPGFPRNARPHLRSNPSPPLKLLKLLYGRCERRRMCLFSGTPGTSRARRCAVRGAANGGRDPKTGAPRSEHGRAAVHCRITHAHGATLANKQRLYYTTRQGEEPWMMRRMK